MLQINLEALEKFLSYSFDELEGCAFKDIAKTPEYQMYAQEMRKIAEKHDVIPHLYEGDDRADGHALTNEEVRAFKRYYETLRDRERIVQRQLLLASTAKTAQQKASPVFANGEDEKSLL